MTAISRETSPPLTGVAAHGEAVVGETAEELEEPTEDEETDAEDDEERADQD